MELLFNKLIIIKAVYLSVTVVLMLSAGCATTDESKTEPAAGIATTLVPPSFDPVSFEHAMSPAGDALRAFGLQEGGGVVLMSGLEERAVPELAFQKTPYQEVIARLAGEIECDYFHTSHYYMILPPEYQALQDLKVGESLDARYQSLSVSAAFGAKTKLYNVFSVLGASLDITIVADNIIAEERCGEMFLSTSPLPVVLEAVLQSARIARDSFIVESTPEYIFIRSVQNTGAENRLLNPAGLTSEQEAMLGRVVSLTLPNRAATAQGAFNAAPISFRDALTPLLEQLGVEIVIKRQLADVPITPCQMKNIRLDTALNLLIRQWPLPEFGFEAQEGRILIREQ